MNDARAITIALRGRWYGGYGVCYCPAHPNTRTPALRLKDGREGRLLAVCGSGCTFRNVAAALQSLGLLDEQSTFEPDPLAGAKRRAEQEMERRLRVDQARRAWNETDAIEGTLAERYLRSRAITGPLPNTLRYHSKAWHGPSAGQLPAMLAAVTLEGEAEPVAVHRTYLAEPGRKADVAPNKAMLGPVAGGAVRLSDGPGPHVVAEGIETGLSLRDALAPHCPSVWAALSATGMAGLRLPLIPGEIVVAPDGDAIGRKAAEELATRAHRLGWNVRLLPAPGDGLDWNDFARMSDAQFRHEVSA